MKMPFCKATLCLFLVAIVHVQIGQQLPSCEASSARIDLIARLSAEDGVYFWTEDAPKVIDTLDRLNILPVSNWLLQLEQLAKDEDRAELMPSLVRVRRALLEAPLMSGEGALAIHPNSPTDTAYLILECPEGTTDAIDTLVSDLRHLKQEFSSLVQRESSSPVVGLTGEWSRQDNLLCWANNDESMRKLTARLAVETPEKQTLLNNRLRQRCFRNLSSENGLISFFATGPSFYSLGKRPLQPWVKRFEFADYASLGDFARPEELLGTGGIVQFEANANESRILIDSYLAFSSPSHGFLAGLTNEKGLDFELGFGAERLTRYAQLQFCGKKWQEACRKKIREEYGEQYTEEVVDQWIKDLVSIHARTYSWLPSEVEKLNRLAYASFAEGGYAVAVDRDLPEEDISEEVARFFFIQPPGDDSTFPFEFSTRNSGNATTWHVDEGSEERLFTYLKSDLEASKLKYRDKYFKQVPNATEETFLLWIELTVKEQLPAFRSYSRQRSRRSVTVDHPWLIGWFPTPESGGQHEVEPTALNAQLRQLEGRATELKETFNILRPEIGVFASWADINEIVEQGTNQHEPQDVDDASGWQHWPTTIESSLFSLYAKDAAGLECVGTMTIRKPKDRIQSK